jgi:hypothetical protein
MTEFQGWLVISALWAINASLQDDYFNVIYAIIGLLFALIGAYGALS